MSSKPPSPPVDFSEGKYTFAFMGEVLKKAIYEKVLKIGLASDSLRAEMKTAIGEDTEYLVGLIIALQAPDSNAKVRWIEAMANRVLVLEAQAEELSRVGKGMADSIVYLLSPAEMEKFGL